MSSISINYILSKLCLLLASILQSRRLFIGWPWPFYKLAMCSSRKKITWQRLLVTIVSTQCNIYSLFAWKGENIVPPLHSYTCICEHRLWKTKGKLLEVIMLFGKVGLLTDFRTINNYFLSPNGFWVISPWCFRSYWLRGHEGESNNCFSKIQLLGKKNIETKHLSLVKVGL